MKRRILAMAAFMILPPAMSAEPAEEVSREKTLATGPAWQDNYEKYQPEADMMDALKAKIPGDMRIDVYLGLWCSDSRNNVPPFIKIVDRLAASVKVRYFSVPGKADKGVKYFIEELKLERVPTFIFYRGEREIGRIIENPNVGMLEDFMEIVFKGD